MKQFIKNAVCILSFAAITASCISCAKAPDTTTIRLLMPGNEPTGWDRILTEYEQTGAQETGVMLDVEWVPLSDYNDKLDISMIGAENYDLVFDAPHKKIRTFASGGIYMPLEDLISSGKYPHLQAAFSDELINYNLYNSHCYGLPIMHAYSSGISCIYYRKDLAKKYGIGNEGQINSYTDFETFLNAVKTNEEDLVPLGITGSRGFFTMFQNDDVELAKNHILKEALGITGYVLLDATDSHVVDIVYEGEQDERFSKFPEKYHDGMLLYGNRLNKIREWNKFVEDDSVNRTDSWYMLTDNMAASMVDNLDTYDSKLSQFNSSLPDAELGVFILNDNVRQMKPEATLTKMMANNLICIPSWSKKSDAALTFLDWLFADRDNHDLFELGIEGEDWQAIGDDKYTPINTEYHFPGYALTWNPNFVRINDSISDDICAYKTYELNIDSYYKSPLSGFTFDTSEIMSEITAVSVIRSSVYTALENGVIDDPITTLKSNTAQCYENGLEVIRQEAIKQINDFLANKNNK